VTIKSGVMAAKKQLNNNVLKYKHFQIEQLVLKMAIIFQDVFLIQ